MHRSRAPAALSTDQKVGGSSPSERATVSAGQGRFSGVIDPPVRLPGASGLSQLLSLTLSVILETVGASRWKIVWLPADCRRSV